MPSHLYHCAYATHRPLGGPRWVGWGGGGGIGVKANTKMLGHLTANSKKFTVTAKINK